MTNLLDIKNLSLSFQTDHGLEPAVIDLSFSLAKGKAMALVGESGSGKSMTSLAIMQLLPATARIKKDSQIIFSAQDLLKLPETAMRKIRGRHIGIVFQEALTALNPVLTIEQQINEVLTQHFYLSRQEQRAEVLKLLNDVGINDAAQCALSYPHQLSGGMRQRAMIACALAGKPDLLIADEPTTSLDVIVQAQILALLKSLQEKTNMALLFITHDLAVAAQIADDIAVMHQGKIVEHNTVKNIFTQPQATYTQTLIKSLPSLKKFTAIAEPQPDKPLLQIKDLKLYFPIHSGLLHHTTGYIKAVDGINVNLAQGHTLALVGASGSGKTTVAREVLQLLTPTAGSVKFHGVELTKLSTHAMHNLHQQMQIIFQDPYASLNPRMLVHDIIEEGMLIHNIGKTAAERQARINELLALVGLTTHLQWRYPHEFSGGQRQRICIARALAVNPQLLVCDEPTSALDVATQMQILELLKRLQKELNIAYLLITHNLGLVAYLAHEVAVMHEGKIVEYGNTANVLTNPQNPYTKQLLAAVPKIPEYDKIDE